MHQYILYYAADAIVISNGPGTVSLKPVFDKFYGKLPILGIGLGFLAISNFLNLELLDLIPAYNGSNFPVIEQTNNRIWQTAMNIDQLVVPDSLSLNLSRKYFDLKSDLLAGFSIKT